MQTCKYQRIVRDGEVVQPGDIDTQAKFADLVQGLDLEGKTVLDVGCNCGEMCRLAAERGAKPEGIDKDRNYIHQARQLHPDLRFSVRSAEMATGRYDVVLASAMFHYVGDYRAFFAQMARVTRGVLVMDVWLMPGGGPVPMLVYGARDRFIPTSSAFKAMASRWFGDIVNTGRTLSPDSSERWVLRLRDPKPIQPKAVLVYGAGGAGKTTYARELLGYQHLQLDQIFVDWYRAKRPSAPFSVKDFVDGLYSRSDLGELAEYMRFHRAYLQRWLRRKVSLDVVIDGYDMKHKNYRAMVLNVLCGLGWSDVSEVGL